MKRKYDYVLQDGPLECGLASLKSILLFYKIDVSNNYIKKYLNITDRGINAYDIVNVSKKLGLYAYGVKSSLKDLKNKLPCIAHVISKENMFHYIVIYEIDYAKEKILIMDPSCGFKTITFSYFDEITTNIFIIFEKEKIKKIRNNRFKKYIINIFKENKFYIFIAISLSIIFLILSIFTSYYLKYIFDFYNNRNKILKLSLIFINIFILKNIISYYKDKFILKVGNNIDKNINKKVISHLIYLPYEYIYEKSSGEIINLLSDIDFFKEIILKIFIISFVDLVFIFIVLLFISFINIYYVLICIFIFLLLIFLSNKEKYIINDNYIKVRNKKVKYNSDLVQYTTSFDTIKSLHLEKKILHDIEKENNNILYSLKNYKMGIYKYNFIKSLFIDIVYVLIIFILISNSSYPNILLLSNLFFLLITFIKDITNTISMSKIYKSSVERVLDLLEYKKEIFSYNNSSFFINTIKYKKLSYLKNNKKILNNINFEINKKDKIFITGKSGIGKSTMIKMLLKYYDYTSGDIFIDNINLKNINLDFIRENILYVGQNEHIFNMSIKENICIKNNKDLDKAMSCVCLDKKIKDNIVIENGSNFSGGERKKIILARSLMNAKNILILDECFNEIDVKEERVILNNIFNNYKNLTIILISHRNDNNDLFNKVYILDKEGIHENTKK